jgi:hypothetical protein
MCGCSFVCLSQVLSKFSEIQPAEVAESRFMAKLPSAQDLGTSAQDLGTSAQDLGSARILGANIKQESRCCLFVSCARGEL